jgi:hypothetical protein
MHLESRLMLSEGKMQPVVYLTMAKKPCKIFFTSEHFRMSVLIGHTIFFSSEKNRMTNMIFSKGWKTTFISQLCDAYISVLI